MLVGAVLIPSSWLLRLHWIVVFYRKLLRPIRRKNTPSHSIAVPSSWTSGTFAPHPIRKPCKKWHEPVPTVCRDCPQKPSTPTELPRVLRMRRQQGSLTVFHRRNRPTTARTALLVPVRPSRVWNSGISPVVRESRSLHHGKKEIGFGDAGRCLTAMLIIRVSFRKVVDIMRHTAMFSCWFCR